MVRVEGSTTNCSKASPGAGRWIGSTCGSSEAARAIFVSRPESCFASEVSDAKHPGRKGLASLVEPHIFRKEVSLANDSTGCPPLPRGLSGHGSGSWRERLCRVFVYAGGHCLALVVSAATEPHRQLQWLASVAGRQVSAFNRDCCRRKSDLRLSRFLTLRTCSSVLSRSRRYRLAPLNRDGGRTRVRFG